MSDTYKSSKKSKRCLVCQKKIKMMSFSCDCGGIFCIEHQSRHSHSCDSLIKQKQIKKETIEKNNPKISFIKLVTI